MSKWWTMTCVGLSLLVGCSSNKEPEQPPLQPTAPQAPAAQARKAATADVPNVLVVVWDTVRADHLSAYGYERPTTPHLQAFAEDAVVFERAVSDGMWTLPSHASMFTGLPVRRHGANARNKWLDDEFTTLAEWLGEAGYDTYLFSANPYLGSHTNMLQGFDQVEYPWSDRWKKPARKATKSKILPNDASNVLGPKWVEKEYKAGRHQDNVKDAGPVATRALRTFLKGRQQPERPFFAVVNFMEAHAPRVPSLQARQSMFSAEQIDAQLSLDQSYPYLLAYTVGKHEYTPAQVETIAQTYDASLWDLDLATHQMMQMLEREGLMDDTIVIITADHGEHLGEDHKIGHKYSLRNPLVRVPLVVRHGSKLPPRRTNDWVNTSHMMVTLAELLDLTAPAQAEGSSWFGEERADKAYAELIHATPKALERVGAVHPDLDPEPFLVTYTSVESDEGKCIRASDGRQMLFRTATDPLETTDVSDREPGLTAALCGELQAWEQATPVFEGRKGGGSTSAGLSDEERARLEALGYVEDETP